MQSFIGWIGGKSRLKKYIIPLIPENSSRYIEVFGGAGWVLFGKPQYKNQIEVFNDINGHLINLYLQIKNNCEQLQSEIDWIHSRQLFKNYIFDIKEQSQELTDIQKAARYFYIIKCSFGSNTYSFATDSTNVDNVIKRLPKIRERLKSVVVENLDFAQLIKTYDRADAVFYLDPPYFGSEKYYSKNNIGLFTQADHDRLNTLLCNIKGKFILSYNDCPYIRNLYNHYNIKEITRDNLLPAKQQKNNKFRELIICNF